MQAWKNKLAELEAVVREAGEMARRMAQTAAVYVKGGADFVTDADLAVSRFLEERLPALIAGSCVLSEEDAEKTGVAGKVFIIDPIDGTTNLMYGMNLSAVSCGYCEDGEPVLAAVYNPFTDEMFLAGRGMGATLNGRPIHVNGDGCVQDALVALELGPTTRDKQDRVFAAMNALQKSCRGLRMTGSAAIDLCYVACGRLTAAAYHYLYPWDFAAGWLVLTEAGGRLSLMDGGAPSLTAITPPILASNALVHEALQEVFVGI